MRLNGQTFADDEPSGPSTVSSERGCDFCGHPPTTHWLTFTPALEDEGFTLPAYLGACSNCAREIDFTDATQLVGSGGQADDIAEVLARHFVDITAGR